MGEPQWRIDELAHRAGLTVDTIRYYARESLLPSPERCGRHKLYGAEHLERLGRIRELQDQRFSLAAIRALLNTDRPGLEALFAGSGRNYSREELIERSGVRPELVDRLHEVGMLQEPAAHGRDAYDDTDLVVLTAIAELVSIGMTTDLIVELGAIYVRHLHALQHEVHDMFSGRSRTDWNDDELGAIQRRLTANSGRMIPAVDKVLNYVHQRTTQQLTLDAIRTAAETGTGVGGVKVDRD